MQSAFLVCFRGIKWILTEQLRSLFVILSVFREMPLIVTVNRSQESVNTITDCICCGQVDKVHVFCQKQATLKRYTETY